MENFLDAKALLEKAGAGIPVSSPMTLAQQAIWFLRHPDALKRYGAKARQAVMTNKGAAQKHAEVIRKLLLSDNGVRAHGALSFFPTRNHSETF
jgi:3-deoxy-D-manno-octulosonic-acid transferase